MMRTTDTEEHGMATIRDTPHPYYGAEAFGYGYGAIVQLEDIDDLIACANSYDEDMNFVYRWDWDVPNPEDCAEDGCMAGEEYRETLTLFVILQRKSLIVNWVAPVTAADEDKVREFLASDRILGALRRTWAPLLDAL